MTDYFDEIEARLGAVPKGPWEDIVDEDGRLLVKMPDTSHDLYIGDVERTCAQCHALAAFIAHSRADLRILLSIARAAKVLRHARQLFSLNVGPACSAEAVAAFGIYKECERILDEALSVGPWGET